uniref:Transmembrane protein n=1 Tax=Trichobilharzia regenti TaxID=157069 RepID=A0AA85IW99_TRIRE|nr:unnamed protein product [Trichobilharzia regenti]
MNSKLLLISMIICFICISQSLAGGNDPQVDELSNFFYSFMTTSTDHTEVICDVFNFGNFHYLHREINVTNNNFSI